MSSGGPNECASAGLNIGGGLFSSSVSSTDMPLMMTMSDGVSEQNMLFNRRCTVSSLLVKDVVLCVCVCVCVCV